MRNLALGILVGLGILVCSVAPSPAAASTPEATSVQLVADPYLELAEVTTSVQMAVRCPCRVVFSCAYKDIGFQCADEPNCCHCSGSDPALRKCVWSGGR